MTERTGAATFKGSPLTLVGEETAVGRQAPDFNLLANDLNEKGLKDYAGKTLILVSVPSLDTPVCDMEARRFNQEAAGLGRDVAVVVVSMDLPFAQKRWCGAAGVEQVETLSDHRDGSFGTAYGLLVKELRLLARAVTVVDRDGKVVHYELVREIADEPDYDAAPGRRQAGSLTAAVSYSVRDLCRSRAPKGMVATTGSRPWPGKEIVVPVWKGLNLSPLLRAILHMPSKPVQWPANTQSTSSSASMDLAIFSSWASWKCRPPTTA